MSPNVASIRDRLLNMAKRQGVDFLPLLDRYACERFLYRLGQSVMRERLILKGASLLSIWMEEPYRVTRDIDLLAMGANEKDAVRDVMRTLCSVPCPADGLEFDLDSLSVRTIRDGRCMEDSELGCELSSATTGPPCRWTLFSGMPSLHSRRGCPL